MQMALPFPNTQALPKQRDFDTKVHLMSLPEYEAWLERDGEQYRLDGNCSIGRAALNTLVIESPKISRLHSIIHFTHSSAISVSTFTGTVCKYSSPAAHIKRSTIWATAFASPASTSTTISS